jgi:hypothetical protein
MADFGTAQFNTAQQISNSMNGNSQPIQGSAGTGFFSSIPFIGSMIDTAINGANSRVQQNRANQANLNLAKYQYDLQQQQYDKANAYNTPAAQMQRFKDAGLNPNLIYGQGNPGNSPNVLPQYHAPEMRYNAPSMVNTSNAIGAYQDFQIKKAQTDNLQAQKANIMQDTSNKAIIQAMNLLNMERTKAGKPYWSEQEEAKTETMKNQRDVNWTRANLNDTQNELAKYNVEMAKTKTQNFSNIIRLSIANADANLKKTLQETTGKVLQNWWQQAENSLYLPSKIVNAIGTIGGTISKFQK